MCIRDRSSDGLADCKTTTRDANLVLGLYSPFKYGLQEHEKYDITKFRNNIRFLYVIEDRDNGSAGQICPLFFDGEMCIRDRPCTISGIGDSVIKSMYVGIAKSNVIVYSPHHSWCVDASKDSRSNYLFITKKA